ncbi:hypothetical protein NC651_025037 [Populus alba x Populus x berolinensis]|nr:hypothetical protein NC651_025037 [Populus alba x Populus x berolinensis]
MHEAHQGTEETDFPCKRFPVEAEAILLVSNEMIASLHQLIEDVGYFTKSSQEVEKIQLQNVNVAENPLSLLGLSLCSGNTVYLNLPTPSKVGNDSQNDPKGFSLSMFTNHGKEVINLYAEKESAKQYDLVRLHPINHCGKEWFLLQNAVKFLLLQQITSQSL